MSFVFRAVDEVGATLNAALVVLGDQLGLLPRPRRARPLHRRRARRGAPAPACATPREWLNAQAAGASSSYDAASAATPCPPSTPSLSPTSPARRSCPGSSRSPYGTVARRNRRRRRPPRLRASAGTSTTHDVHLGCERFFRPGLPRATSSRRGCRLSRRHLTKLRAGPVADVGCGHGSSTVLMAQAFPALDASSAPTTTRSRSSVARARHRRRCRRPGHASRSRRADGFSGRGLRPGHDVRLPARHGRPRRCRSARPRGPRRRTAPG